MSYERIISADSHTIEPQDLWVKALGRQYGDETPRVVEGHLGQPGLFFYTGKQYARFKEQDQKTAEARHRKTSSHRGTGHCTPEDGSEETKNRGDFSEQIGNAAGGQRRPRGAARSGSSLHRGA